VSLTTAQLEFLASKGLSFADAIELSRLADPVDNRSSAAKRQARYRNAKRNERDVTSDVTPPLNDNISNPPRSVTSSDEEDNGAIIDPAKIVFDSGVALITAAGKSEGQARAWLGKKRQQHGDADLIAAIGMAKREGAIDPIPWLERCLGQKQRAQPTVPL